MSSRSKKPSEIAVEAKRVYIPQVEQHLPNIPARSFAYYEVEDVEPATSSNSKKRTRVAVINADAIDVALDWNASERRYKVQDEDFSVPQEQLRIPLILPVDEKRAGGDWESGSMAPEENLSRRSNFVRCLARNRAIHDECFYPIPSKGGIYSPQVVIFRSGPSESYYPWPICSWAWLPVISVAPGRRPKLTPDGADYTFAQERELMREKIRTALRLAAAWGHRDICVGNFGFGPGFRNPVRQLARMWRECLYEEEEFRGEFGDVVFAIENGHCSPSSTSSSSSLSSFAGSSTTATSTATTTTAGAGAGAAHGRRSGTGKAGAVEIGSAAGSSANASAAGSPEAGNASGSETESMTDYEIFKEEFEPSSICKTSFR